MSDSIAKDKSPIASEPRNKPKSPALRRCEKAVRQNPDDAHNWFNLGKLLLDSGRNPEAEAALRQALDREPGSANYRYYLANALGNEGKFAEAAVEFSRLAAIDPQLQDPMSTVGLSVLTDLAYCMGEMGDWQAAFDVLQPAAALALSVIGDLAAFKTNAKEHDFACFLYSVALLLAPQDAELQHGAGHCHLKSGRLREALTHLKKASKADPKDPDIWYDFGLALSTMRKGRQARPCFRKALQLDPKHFWAWYDLACLDALGKKPDAAFRNLYKSIECGFANREHMAGDADLRGLHKDPRWKLALEMVSGSGSVN